MKIFEKQIMTRSTCEECAGTGNKEFSGKCEACKNSGWIKAWQSLESLADELHYAYIRNHESEDDE